MIEVKELKTKSDLRKFATFPLKLYKNCPYYVPSLRSDEMATFNPKKNFSLAYSKAKGFLCYKDGELVGRIAGIISDVDNKNTGKKLVRFSRFECINDLNVFKALLNAVENYGKENGMEIMHGPWGFNDQDREGMLTDGFEERATYATNYYYPYFSKNMRTLGFNDESKWVEFNFVIPKEYNERMDHLAQRIKEKYHLRDVAETMSVKEIVKKYGDSMFETLNESYGKLDGYVKVEGKMKENVLSQFATICNIKYVSMVVDENEEVVAFGVVLPSICEALKKSKGRLTPNGIIRLLKSIKKPQELEMALIGTRDKYKNLGLNAIIISRIFHNIVDNNIKVLESNPMLEHNLDIQAQWKFLEYSIKKRRQTFIKEIK